MIDDENMSTLSIIDRVEDVRIIQLSLKNIVTDSIYTYYYYLELPISYINCGQKSNFCSIHFKLPYPLGLIDLCKIVIDKLILSLLNSLDGVSIVTQQSLVSSIMLNVSKPTVLQ